MGKRLAFFLALAFVVGITAVAFAEVQNIKVSGDITTYGIGRDITLNKNTGASDNDLSGIIGDSWGELGQEIEAAFATVTTVRIDADLTDNVSTTVKLLNERYWGSEQSNTDTGEDGATDIDLALAYVTLKEFLYSPLTLTIGRQEIHFGNDMIWGDPDDNGNVSSSSAFNAGALTDGRDADLSARKGFDAIRANFNYDPFILDIIAVKINEGSPDNNDDTNVYGFNAAWKVGKIGKLMDTLLEAYFWDATILRAGATTAGNVSKNDRVETIGARLVTSPVEQMIYQLESAWQVGSLNPDNGTDGNADLKAWALETALTFNWSKSKYTPSLTGMFAYFSGDKGSLLIDEDQASHGWIPLAENQTFGNIANALMPQSNVRLIGLIGTMKPAEDIMLKGEYYAYWWAKDWDNILIQTNRGNWLQMTDKKFAGQEIDITATYNYTEDVQFNLLGGILIPGSSFHETNDNIGTELIGSMKVTF